MALVRVVFEWDDRHGPCYDCGLPAAYRVVDISVAVCSVCAAGRAANGDTVESLNTDR